MKTAVGPIFFLILAFVGSTSVLAAPAPPENDALALGRQLADTGDFQALLKTGAEVQIGELQRDTPGLSAADKEQVARIGRATMEAARARIVEKLGAVYARAFGLPDLKAMVAFFASPAGKAYAGRYATTLPELAKTLQGFDFKRETLRAVCSETRKACPAK
ncbi:MAG: DUF2059 domain-containing protein [Caulobacteraceae bacterium]|nr:DUF2059 domain-containing protein [Caulobacteraceae bacterium]